MARPLVVVESPAKAKTISRFLGGEYDVRASVGHVADLPSKGLAVDVENGFKPTYELTERGKQVVKELRAALRDASELYLATDEDREGEAISWHLLEQLKPRVPVKRMVFHEITKAAIDDAVANPRGIDYGLVDAAETRRVLDRLYGYEVSPVLWRRVNRGLSAGRVQSVALRLVCDRELEIEQFKAQEYWSLAALLATAKNETFLARLTSIDGKKLEKFDIADEATAMRLKAALEGGRFVVQSVESKSQRGHPAPPFTTPTLQQEASRKLGFSPRHTMQIAQRLYEGVDMGGESEGLITYMRTDGVQIAPEAIAADIQAALG